MPISCSRTSKRQAAAATLALLAGAAGAQSTISLSGVMDLGVRSTKNSSGRIESVASGSNSTSRWVLRATEDLGAGWRAGIHLEGSIAADTGTPGTGAQTFDRQSTVQIAGPFGEVRLGRDWTPTYYGFVFADPWINTGVGSGSNFLNASAATAYQRAFGSALSPTTLSRSSNAVEYWLPPNLGGVYGNLMVSAGENGNAVGNFRYRSARLGFKQAPFDVALYGGATRIDATGQDLKQTGVFGSWQAGPVTLLLSVTDSRYMGSKHRQWMGGVRAVLGQWVIKASYNRLDQKGVNAAGASIDANDAGQWALGADYLLSKRTAVYGQTARLANKGAATFAVPGGPAVVAPGSSSRGIEFGLRHNF